MRNAGAAAAEGAVMNRRNAVAAMTAIAATSAVSKTPRVFSVESGDWGKVFLNGSEVQHVYECSEDLRYAKRFKTNSDGEFVLKADRRDFETEVIVGDVKFIPLPGRRPRV